MRNLLILLIATLTLVCAKPDYFEILQDQFEQKLNGKVRTFYITAEEGIWDYASQCRSKSNVPNTNVLGTRYYKALYHEYKDASFTEKKPRFHWQGNMGPILRAEIGDTIQVHFWNKATRNYTMHPHGVFYEFEMEGAIFKGAFEKSVIEPNQNYTYTWKVLPRAGPGPKDGDSLVWGYHSHVSESDIYAGLYGSIVVYKPGKLSNDQIVTSLFVADENLSPYLSRTMSTLYPNATKFDDNEIYRANQFHSINGLVSSSPNDLVIKKKADWHLLGWGTYWDVQYVKWESGDLNWSGTTVDHIRLMPASFYTVTIKPKSSGQFSFGSLDNEADGMMMQYTVSM